MADETPRLGFRRPTNLDTVAYDLDLNDIRNQLDAAIDRVFTSATRPAIPYVGMSGFETDTDRFVIWDGTIWRYTDIVPVATPAERDALPTYEGMRIYRTDKGWEETYSSGAWHNIGIQLVDALANVPAPYTNQIVNLAGVLKKWNGTSWEDVVSSADTTGKRIDSATGIDIASSGAESTVSASKQVLVSTTRNYRVHWRATMDADNDPCGGTLNLRVAGGIITTMPVWLVGTASSQRFILDGSWPVTFAITNPFINISVTRVSALGVLNALSPSWELVDEGPQ